MKVVSTIAETRAELNAHRAAGRSVGLVPTMGFLHAGHASLIERAAADNDVVLTTIFVNPLQFAPDEDLEAYPRDLERDSAICEQAGATLVLHPEVDEMYPLPPFTSVTVATISAAMEGESRPTHFAGVATVVSKLFNIAGPCRAYFGEKDWQQLAVIRRMVIDLSFPVEVVGCPIVREPNGLAMSSRNVYLTAEERTAAAVLQQSLQQGAALIEAGERDAAVVRAHIVAQIETEPLVATPDYVAIVDASTLEDRPEISGELRLLLAAQVGKARLIDNVGATAP